MKHLGRFERFFVVFLLFFALSGCSAPSDEQPVPEAPCTAEIAFEMKPREMILAVGESATARLLLTTCGGSQTIPATFTWTSSNPAVASVDKESGEITGHSVGKVEVTVAAEWEAFEGRFLEETGDLPVNVVAAQ